MFESIQLGLWVGACVFVACFVERLRKGRG